MKPETFRRIQDHLDTENILNCQRRNRTMRKRIAWTIFWCIIASAVIIIAVAIVEPLSLVLEALEEIGA